MSWKRFGAVVCAAVVTGWASGAGAADDSYGRSGPYVGGGALYAFESFSGAAGSPAPDGSWGYDFEAGYRFNEWFAIQGAWQHMVEFDHSTGGTEVWMIGADMKLYPFHGVVQPFVLAGLGWGSVNDDRAASSRNSTGMAFRFGGGVEVYLTERWALTADAGYVLQTSGRSDYGSFPISFGVMYRFF